MDDYFFPTIVCEIKDLKPLKELGDILKCKFIFSDFTLRLIDGDKVHEALIQLYSRELLLDEGMVVVPEPIPEKEDKFPEVSYYIQFSEKYGMQIMVGQVTDVKDEVYRRYEKIDHDYCTLIIRALITIMEKIESREKAIRKVDRSRKVNSRGENHLSKKDNKILLLDDLIEYVVENNLYQKSVKHSQISCPCWSVRGHYRTYKSGKKVFVKPFEKGKKRGKVAPKQHVYTI